MLNMTHLKKVQKQKWILNASSKLMSSPCSAPSTHTGHFQTPPDKHLSLSCTVLHHQPVMWGWALPKQLLQRLTGTQLPGHFLPAEYSLQKQILPIKLYSFISKINCYSLLMYFKYYFNTLLPVWLAALPCKWYPFKYACVKLKDNNGPREVVFH